MVSARAGVDVDFGLAVDVQAADKFDAAGETGLTATGSQGPIPQKSSRNEGTCR
jgi:hypothetical protein